MTLASKNILDTTARPFRQALATRPKLLVGLGLSLLVSLSYLRGLGNQPVAEDFIDPLEFLKLGDEKQFRPVFGALMLGLKLLVGTPTEAPVVYHLFSLLLHLAATLALWRLAGRLTASRSIPIVAALLFALYPRQHEPVFWPASSLHSLMTLCLLLSLSVYIKGRTSAQTWQTYLPGAVGLFGLGLFSSEAGLVGIPLLAVYEWLWQRRPGSWPTIVRLITERLWPFGLMLILYMTALIIGSANPLRLVQNRRDTGFYHLRLDAASLLNDFGGYLSYSLFPFVPLRSIDAATLKAGMLLVTIVVLSIGLLKGSRLVRFGIGWLILAVLPYTLLVPFGNADRYFYLASVGFALGLAASFDLIYVKSAEWLSTTSRRLVWVGGLVGLSIYGLLALSSLQERAVEWQTAGEQVSGMLNQVYAGQPVVKAETSFYFVNLPRQYKRAMLMGVGVRPALRTYYRQPELNVNARYDPELLRAIQQADPTGQPDAGVVIYVYEDGQLVNRSASYADPVVRRVLAEGENTM